MSELFFNFSRYADLANKCVRFIYKPHLSYVLQSPELPQNNCTWLMTGFLLVFFFKGYMVQPRFFLDLSFYLYPFA